jgi:hypothetical protein
MPDDLRVIRSVGRCIALTIVSFGFWGFAWMYHTTKEVSSRVNQPPPSAGLRTFLHAVPIANLVVWFLSWRDIEEYCKRSRSEDFPMVLFWLLTVLLGFPGFVTLPIVQMRMNDAHRTATNGQAQNARMQVADWVAIAVGWAFLVIWVLLIAVIIVAATSDSS